LVARRPGLGVKQSFPAVLRRHLARRRLTDARPLRTATSRRPVCRHDAVAR
jgi:hypothetical protein